MIDIPRGTTTSHTPRHTGDEQPLHNIGQAMHSILYTRRASHPRPLFRPLHFTMRHSRLQPASERLLKPGPRYQSLALIEG